MAAGKTNELAVEILIQVEFDVFENAILNSSLLTNSNFPFTAIYLHI
jgi:hypothetical protein